jgi:molecular chaperone GrpE (heat shock protein)
VAQVEAAANALEAAHSETTKHLEELTQMLGEAHEEFAASIKRTLKDGSTAFHQELATATNHLRGAIEDLGDVLDNLPAAA